MAPRPAIRRERDNDFSAVGKIGRRTGVTLPQGRLDANGIEEITGIFSSPRKPSPLRKSIRATNDVEEKGTSDQSEQDMVGMDSTGLTPTQVLSTRKSLRGPSLPRSTSPRKTGINGTARRSNGVDVLAPAKELPQFDPEDRENSPIRTPSRRQAPVGRSSPNPENSPLRDITTNQSPTTDRPRSEKGKQVVAVVPNVFEEYVAAGFDDEDGRPPIDSIEDGDDVFDNIEVTKTTPLGDDHEAHDVLYDEEAFVRPTRDNDDDEDEDQTFRPEQEMPKANSRKKRKSEVLNQDIQVEPGASRAYKQRKLDANTVLEREDQNDCPAAAPVNKRVKKTRQKAAQQKQAPPPAEFNPKGPQLSADQEAQLDQIIERVKSRPGQPKSLYILRRETPADGNVTHTRSGRISIKPLAYWRSERLIYGDSPSAPALADGARFPCNSIKEVIRTEEVDLQQTKKRKGKKRKGKEGGGGKSGGRARSREDDGDESSSEEADEADDNLGAAEPWESKTGIYRGPVSVWDQQQQAPLETEEEVDLAYSAAALQMRQIKDSTCKFAKLLSTPFFGTGIVELPPGGVKSPKNARKMHMSFFVVCGRVTVEVGPVYGPWSRFSVGAGGFWQVPRGNQYSIENELHKTARVFFSQGCELAPEPVDDAS